MALVSLHAVTMRFGGLTAIQDLSFAVEEGEILALIGPNGAGKSTVFNLITALYRPTTGSILVGDLPLTELTPSKVPRFGISRTFQNIRLFPGMTVAETVAVGCHILGHSGLFGALFPWCGRIKSERTLIQQRITDVLTHVGLADRADDLATSLAYGEQRRLEIARALACRPKLLLLDEPAAGMNPLEKRQLAEMIATIRAQGTAIIVVEHDMRFVMGIADRIVVLDHGIKIAEGKPEYIRNNPAVIEAYLKKQHA